MTPDEISGRILKDAIHNLQEIAAQLQEIAAQLAAYSPASSSHQLETQGTEFERHYTPQELGDLWGFDHSTIRRMFIDEPGVLKEGKQARRNGKRIYVSIRIPASIAQRVHDRKSR
jgi:hypothetical protein